MTLKELKAKHNTSDGRSALNRELRANHPGGPELLDSIAEIDQFFIGHDRSPADARKVLQAVRIKLNKAADLMRDRILANSETANEKSAS